MKTSRIDALKMVRRIRDSPAKSLARKSDADVIAFFRAAGEAALVDARAKARQRRRRVG